MIDDAKVFNSKLQEWEDYYNYDRPHGGLDGQTPYERLKRLFGIWRGLRPHRTTIEPSTRQFGLPA